MCNYDPSVHIGRIGAWFVDHWSVDPFNLVNIYINVRINYFFSNIVFWLLWIHFNANVFSRKMHLQLNVDLAHRCCSSVYHNVIETESSSSLLVATTRCSPLCLSGCISELMNNQLHTIGIIHVDHWIHYYTYPDIQPINFVRFIQKSEAYKTKYSLSSFGKGERVTRIKLWHWAKICGVREVRAQSQKWSSGLLLFVLYFLPCVNRKRLSFSP